MKPLFVSMLLMANLALQAPAFAETLTVPESATEITAVGDAPYAESPNWASFLLKISQTSATATEAAKSLDEKAGKVQLVLRPIDSKLAIRFRGDEYSAGPGNAALKNGVPVTIVRNLLVGTAEVGKLAQLIDLAAQQPGAQVESVHYQVLHSGQPMLDAIELASQRAKLKAELVAKKLGVNLGPLVSAVVTEEPEGEALRERLQQGGESLQYGDKVLHVYVTVRFSIGK